MLFVMKPWSCSIVHFILSTIPHNHQTNNDLSISTTYIHADQESPKLDGSSAVRAMAEQIGVVWISHPHADHHLGLIRLLQVSTHMICDLKEPTFLSWLEGDWTGIDWIIVKP